MHPTPSAAGGVMALHRQQLDACGLTTLPLLSSAAVAGLAAAYHALVPDPAPGFSATLIDPDAHVRHAAHAAVCATLWPALAQVTGFAAGARLVNGSFAVRAAGSAAADMPWHQDWSFVDETRHRALGIWVPLVDVDAGLGCLEVVPGSHASAHPLRAPGDPFLYTALLPRLQPHVQALPLRAGEAVIFDQRLFHRSSAHHGTWHRVAAAAVLIPADARLERCRRSADGTHALEPVPDDHYLLQLVRA